MGININTTGTQRTGILSENFIFKVITWEQGEDENKSELELSETKILTNTINLRSLGIESWEDLESIKDTCNELHNNIINELKSVLPQIKEVIANTEMKDIWLINVQKKLKIFEWAWITEEAMEKLGKIQSSGREGRLIKFVKHIADNIIKDEKYRQNFKHTFSNFPANFWEAEDGNIYLYDGWVLWEWKEVLRKIWDEMFDILNGESDTSES